MTEMPINLRPDAFSGTADAYARYRPPYPPRMLADLLERAAVGSGLLVDLATGPGRIALDLAARFGHVIAIDLEPDMIDVARRRAADRGITNVEWHVGRAEDLDVAPTSVDLVTIGEAFHRLEQSVIAVMAFGWLRPGGCLATLGTDGRFSGDADWHLRIRAVRDRWLERLAPDGVNLWLPSKGEGQARRERVLREAGFASVEGHDHTTEVELTFDEISGFLQSTSFCSRNVLHGQYDAFEADLRRELGADDASRFPDTLSWGYTLARKPA